MSRLRNWVTASRVRIVLAVLAGAFLVIQLIPYGRDHTDPPVTSAAAFDSPRTEQLVDQACGACHSNMTTWPPESNVAPFSWLIQHDVDEGRTRLNFSEWDRAQPSLDEVTNVISEGEMPPLQYKVLHSSARLSDAEKADLIAGLRRTYAADPPGGG
jgi:mono/diheme cytochrome c family protein